MKKKYKNVEFTIQYYQYSDHATSASMVVIDHIYGKHSYYTIQLTNEQKNKLWNIAISQGKDSAIAEVKRLFRQQTRECHSYNLYPFWLEGKREYINTRGSYVKSNASLQNRLQVAKRQKEDFEYDKWEYSESASTEGTMEVINGKLKMVKKEERSSTRKILEDSQFCKTVYTLNFWNNIQEQIKVKKEKEEKRIKAIQNGIENLKYNIKQEKERLASGAPRTWQIENWLEVNEKRLAEYEREGWNVA